MYRLTAFLRLDTPKLLRAERQARELEGQVKQLNRKMQERKPAQTLRNGSKDELMFELFKHGWTEH